MALRRLGYGRWLRNLAVALGNAPASGAVVAALEARAGRCGEVVNEHIAWALAEQAEKAEAKPATG
ncbi:MAG TPA: tRNA epoxyqueuosine(34) reductase QueG, partial [Plasticicumulans sp.]|nr:tRNA epoxyqueuosine(34) reductase QueG [Plasticicumulans sp.]